MKIPSFSLWPHSTRGLLATAALVTIAAGATACGGGPSTTSASPTADASSTASSRAAPSSSGSMSASAAPSSPGSTSASAAPSVAPVPVEKNPPGDIPDNLAFVKYSNKPGGYSFTHPEGWAQTGTGTRVRFTDKLNGVIVDSVKAGAAPTVASARSRLIPQIRASVPAFELRDVSAVTLPAGSGVHIVFRRNSVPDQVTGKVFRDEVEEYAVYGAGRLVRMDLYGPVGADNVDAYRTMSQSLSIR